MPLTSQIKELGAILQKLIKFAPGLIQIDKHDKHLMVGVVGDADELLYKVVGSGQRTETNFVLTRTRNEKSRFQLCLDGLKKVIIIRIK
jgi:hypothetical protein